ncbi:MAG: metallophosphoesterase [Chloroflexi bacterium]|nr:metallophosphoesterase [Chloroflexota bacterium]
MKKLIFLWLAVFASALLFGFLAWAFSQHGTIGLFRVNGTFHLAFIVLALFSIVLLILAILERRLLLKRRAGGIRFLSCVVRIMTLLGIVIPLLAFVYVGVVPGSLTAAESPQLLVADGTGTNDVPNMAVTFNTAKLTINTVKWGSESASVTLSEEKPSKQHVFMLSNLEPDTDYWYQVNEGQAYHFKTPPTNGQPLRFAVFSDAHFGDTTSHNDRSSKMLQYIADPANSFNMLFSLGDLVDYGFKDSQWQEAFQALSPTTSAIPTKYAAGNHDTLLGGLKRYEAYCYPIGMELQTGTRLWQRIDVGRVHFLVIDLEWSAESYTREQSAWLEKQLTSIPSEDWTIVMGHGFYYASGSISNGWRWYDNPETIQKLTPLFEKYGVDMVFSGHAHQLELLQKEGVTYIVCGAFGHPLEPERESVSPESVWYSVKAYAFVDVTVDGSEASLVFRDSNYSELNSFVIPKR